MTTSSRPTLSRAAYNPRRLSSVLVDHLGAHDPLRPQDAVAALA
ncbi:hypothetical protein [Streptomyces sp. NPDC057740]